MQNINFSRYAGVLIPVFSLRSRQGFGVGEFLDLCLLVDWAKKAGIRLIQLLPVYDTTIHKNWLDSYCYSSVSMFALHPLYLRIEKTFSHIPEEIKKEIESKRKILNQADQLDYEEVYREKMTLLKKIFHIKNRGVFDSLEWKEFFDYSCEWLMPYAAFSVLRDRFGTSDTTQWSNWNRGSKDTVNEICNPSSEFYSDVCFYYFLQFELHKQLIEVRNYAIDNKVLLKGDFPVGVHRWSAEVWANPNLFDLEKNIGAPPDYFNLAGQNWQLPAYDWKEMKEQNYKWFIARLQHMQRYYQLVRIDHIFGYFRFWEIPKKSSKGALGHFNPSIAFSLKDLPLEIQNDLSRYTNPFITEEVLEAVFGSRKDFVKNRLFEKGEKDRYNFKKPYTKEEVFETLNEFSFEEKQLLSQLFENVLLVEEERSFYPRIGLERTLSFSYLPLDKQNIIKGCYALYDSLDEDKLWQETAIERLSLFKESTTMEICAEDLGMAPRCTKKVLEDLGFLCLYIQRLPKKEGEDFSNPAEYEYLSVCSPSNHDTAPLRLWWKQDRVAAEKFYKSILQEEGAAPHELSQDLCARIIQMHLDSPSKWAVFLLQDLLATDSKLSRVELEKERINDPSIYPFYWRWRLHIPLEDLLAEEAFTASIKESIVKSGRSV